MKIARVPGNLAILQKCTPGDTKLIPVEHDDEAHHASPPTKAKGRSSGSSSSILFAQKEFIIAEVDKYRTTDALASFLLNTKRIVATPHQKDHLGQFVKAVQQFKDRNRKFVESVPPEQMTGNVLLEVLELLKTLPHLWLHSLDYNVATGQFTSTIFFPIDVFARAEAFAKTFHGVQLEIDYFFLKPVTASWVVGHVGVSCLKRIY